MGMLGCKLECWCVNSEDVLDSQEETPSILAWLCDNFPRTDVKSQFRGRSFESLKLGNQSTNGCLRIGFDVTLE